MRSPAFVIAVALGLLTIAFFFVRPVGAPGIAMRDFEAFYGAGATANRGEDPYGRAIWKTERTLPGIDASHDETLPFVGPSAGLPLWRALAHLRFDVAGRIWGALLGVAMLIVVFGGLALAGAPREAATIAGVAVLAASYGPLISDAALGQVALIAAAAIVAALLLLRTRAWLCAAIPVACTALQPSLALVLAARLTDARALASAVAGAAIFFAFVLANGGAAGFFGYLQLLAAHNAAEAATVIQITPAGVAHGFGASPMVAEILHAIVAAAAIALVVVASRLRRDPVVRVAIASCALPLVIPFFHEHDFVLTLLPAIVCATRARGTVLAFSAVAVTASGVDWLGLGQRPNGELQSVILSASCALGFAVATGLKRESYAALAIPFVVAATSLVAHAHPVPIWPDALPPHWQPPTSAGISEVWRQEQAISGLDAVDPVWAALRAASLLAGVLLGIATFAAGKPEERASSITRWDERLGVRGLATPVLSEGTRRP